MMWRVLWKIAFTSTKGLKLYTQHLGRLEIWFQCDPRVRNKMDHSFLGAVDARLVALHLEHS